MKTAWWWTREIGGLVILVAWCCADATWSRIRHAPGALRDLWAAMKEDKRKECRSHAGPEEGVREGTDRGCRV